jgi:hypothetical protein
MKLLQQKDREGSAAAFGQPFPAFCISSYEIAQKKRQVDYRGLR